MHPVSHYELLHLPIVSLDTAEVVGEVDGLVLDMSGLRVAALVTRMGFYEASLLPFESAHAVGRDAVMVSDESVVRRIGKDRRLVALIEADASLSGSTVLTTEGRAVGVVGAYYLDRDTGRLAGVQLIPPIEIDTAPEGLVPFSAVHRVGESLVIIEGGYQAALVQNDEELATAMAASIDAAPPVTPAPQDGPPAAGDAGGTPASDDAGGTAASGASSAAQSGSQEDADAADRPKERRPRRSRSRRRTEPTSSPAGGESATAEVESAPAAGESETAEVESATAGVGSAVSAAAAADTLPAAVEAESAAVGGPEPSSTAEEPAGPQQPDPLEAGAPEPPERHFLIGRRVLRRIETPDGTVIAEGGETVTAEMVRRARASDQLLILGLNAE